MLGIEPKDEEAEARFSNLVHWGYGTGWGVVRGLLGAMGLSAGLGTAIHLAAVWGTEAAMLPALGVAPPVSEWGTEGVAIDVWHHVVYAVSTGLAYGLLDQRDA